LSSNSYRENSRTCRLATALAILSLSALAGCGFQPLNAKRDLSSSTVEQMSDVKIALIQADRDQENLPTNPYRVDVSRLGQQMRTELLNSFNPNGAAATAHYELHVTLKVTEVQVAQDPSGLSQNYTTTVTATYSLVTIRDGKSVLGGTSAMTNDYAVIENSYSTVVSREDAETRAMRGVAQDIARRTALYFKRQPISAD
jgi:hypothetical protein